MKGIPKTSKRFSAHLSRKGKRIKPKEIEPKKTEPAEFTMGERRFKSLIQEGSDLVAILDESSHYSYVSPASIPILGMNPSEFMGKSAFEFLHEEDVHWVKEKFAQVINTKRIKIAPYRFRHKDGQYRWLETVITNLKDDPAVKGIVASSRDVSDLLNAARKIEEPGNQYASLIKSLPIAFYTCDTEGRILLYNKAAIDLWGREPIAGKDLWCGSWKIFKSDGNVMPHDEYPVALALKERKPLQGIEIMIQKPDGSIHHLLQYPAPLFNSAGELTGALNVLIDITERKNMYTQLVKTEMDIRNFAKQQNNLLEDERSRIAREIHDEFGQQLAGIKMSLSTLLRPSFLEQHPADTDTAAMVRGMINEVDNTMQLLRKFATELRPGILDTLGLIASIEWLAEEFENKTRIACQLHISVQEHFFEKGISTCFFRICQEGLANIKKHANATEVTIHILQSNALLKLTIADNGKGIVKEELDNPFSMGILGMRERASLVGARLSITSEKNAGTIIHLTTKLNGM